MTQRERFLEGKWREEVCLLYQARLHCVDLARVGLFSAAAIN